MEKIKVLVVDDSAFMRKMVTDMLNTDDSIEVVDTARDGIWALEKLKSLDVDVVTLDVEMPKMNGFETLKKINELYKKPVLMLSSLTREGADITIKALELGAFDFVLKPSFSKGMDKLRDELIEKIKVCCKKNRGIAHRLGRQNTAKREGASALQFAENRNSQALSGNAKEQDNAAIKAVCIAASTGGPKALSMLMPMFPESFKLPVLIVQHMPAGFTKAFAARLDGLCKLNVKEGEHGETIRQGWVYVAPGGYHMEVKNGRIELNQEPAVHGVRPCADKLFTSAAEDFGKVLGVVLTGMGRDGTSGLLSIKDHGGICIAEDESTCTIFGMPKSAIEKGAAHIVAPLYKIVDKIMDIIEK